jgi:BirA family transcriptional regulator, biotin operon repressor / biotin---[acetyl-CoA-carboxylase] ligase
VSEDLTFWAEHLEDAIEQDRLSVFDRVYVLTATNSTQDAARRLCGSRPGAVVIASRQLAGRGRLGRTWEQKSGLGIAMTFVLPDGRFNQGQLALAGGVAAVRAAEHSLGGTAARLGLRWPNDVLEREKGRKLGGVLVEISSPLALLGIGVNILQEPGDWPEHLSGRACSLRELGAACERLEFARTLMRQVERALTCSPDELVACWSEHDLLRGSRSEFVCGGRKYCGTVESISPTHEISIRLDGGQDVRLPAALASLVWSGSPPPA